MTAPAQHAGATPGPLFVSAATDDDGLWLVFATHPANVCARVTERTDAMLFARAPALLAENALLREALKGFVSLCAADYPTQAEKDAIVEELLLRAYVALVPTDDPQAARAELLAKYAEAESRRAEESARAALAPAREGTVRP